jgi:pimeloyl-ACP methyl ester carboxylesterase
MRKQIMTTDAGRIVRARYAIGLLVAALLSVGLPSCQTNVAQTWTTPPGASTQIVNGYPLTYRARGSGPTVVFVGGVLTDYRVWDRALSSWESQFRVVAVSPRHFFPEKWNGKANDFTVRQHAKDLDAFIESLGGPVFLVGWSYGAHISYEAARARPDLVKKLVLVEAPLDSLLPTAEAGPNAVRIQRANETEKYFAAGDIDGGLMYAIDAINGPGVWAATPEAFRKGLRDNAWTVVGIGREEAPRVTCADFGALPMPVLLVQGELTTPRFHQLVAEQSRCLPQAKVVTIPKAGHPSPLINPSAFHSEAASFLQP